jgi:hypothetical protein
MPTIPTASGKTKIANKSSKICSFWTKRMSNKHLLGIIMTRISTTKCSRKKEEFLRVLNSSLETSPKSTKALQGTELRAVLIPKATMTIRANCPITKELPPHLLALLRATPRIRLNS